VPQRPDGIQAPKRQLGELSPEIEKSDYFDYLVPFGQLLAG